ncbi:MAG: ABC transporter permease [Chloroflexota bacterium]|nr:ABC transporter permease [Chloroflexota bacterium]
MSTQPETTTVEGATVAADAGVRSPAQQTSWFTQNRAYLVPYLLIAILLAAAAIRAPGFVSPGNLTQQLALASYLGIIAGGQTLVILTGGIDLSVAWNLNLSAILLTQLSTQMPVPAAAAIALGAASFVGLVNGLGVAYLRIPSLVMTLGMNAVLAGYTLVFTNGTPQGEAPQFARDLAVGRIGGALPWALVFWALFSIGLVFLLRRTIYGKRLYAIGNNVKASYLSGVPVRRVLVATYVLCGLSAGLGGVMLTGYSQQSYLGMGDAYVLPAIAAVVVGGTSILGGSGGYIGTIAGAITIVLLQNVLQIVGIKPAGQQILYGLIILLMLFVYGRNARVRE